MGRTKSPVFFPLLGCQYVLHSTAQLYSHKRKHERREFDHAYRTFRNLQQKAPSTSVKKEGQNGKNSPSLDHISVSQTKILPLPASAVAKLQMVPKMSGQTSGNDNKQVLHIKVCVHFCHIWESIN